MIFKALSASGGVAGKEIYNTFSSYGPYGAAFGVILCACIMTISIIVGTAIEDDLQPDFEFGNKRDLVDPMKTPKRIITEMTDTFTQPLLKEIPGYNIADEVAGEFIDEVRNGIIEIVVNRIIK